MRKIIFGISCLAIISCKKKDVEAPVVTNFSFADGSTTMTVDSATNFTIKAQLSDNQNLKEVKLDIHNAFDGHGHKALTDWSTVLIDEISGELFDYSKEITIPNDAMAGPYHVNIQVLDETGFETEVQTIFLNVNRADAPQIVITQPDFSVAQSYSKGSTISLEGVVIDGEDLASVEITIELESEEVEEQLYYEKFTLSGVDDEAWDMQADGNLNINIPSGATSGKYGIKFRVIDSDGNNTIEEYDITVQ